MVELRGLGPGGGSGAPPTPPLPGIALQTERRPTGRTGGPDEHREEDQMKRRYGAGIAVAAGAAAAGLLLARRWQLRWGATAQELAEPLPGDELITGPDLAATRAPTVRAAADRVWPWIAQLGQARGGFYSYDFLENLAAISTAPTASSPSGRTSRPETSSGCTRR